MNNNNSIFHTDLRKLVQLSKNKFDHLTQNIYCNLFKETYLTLNKYIEVETEFSSITCPFIRLQHNLHFFKHYVEPLFEYKNDQNIRFFINQRIQTLRVRQVEKQMSLLNKETNPIKKIIDYTLYRDKENLSFIENELLIRQIIEGYEKSFEFNLYNEIKKLADSSGIIYFLQLELYNQGINIGAIQSITTEELEKDVHIVYTRLLKVYKQNILEQNEAKKNEKQKKELLKKEEIEESKKIIRNETLHGQKTLRNETIINGELLDKKTQTGLKLLDKKTQVGEELLYDKTQIGEETLGKKTEVGEKLLDKKTQTGLKLLDEKTQVGEEFLDERTQTGGELVEKKTHDSLIIIDNKTTDNTKALEHKTHDLNNIIYEIQKSVKENDQNTLAKQIIRFERIDPLKEEEFIQAVEDFFQLEIIYENPDANHFDENMAKNFLTIFQTNNPISELNLNDFLTQFNSIAKNLISINLIYFFIAEIVNNKTFLRQSNNSFYERFNEIIPLNVKKDTIKKYVAEPTKISERIKKSVDKNKLIKLKTGAPLILQNTNKHEVVVKILRKIKDISN